MLFAAVVSYKELRCQSWPWLFFFKGQLLRLWHCPTFFYMFLTMLWKAVMVQLLGAPFSLVFLSDRQVLCDGTRDQVMISPLHATFALVHLNTAKALLEFPKQLLQV